MLSIQTPVSPLACASGGERPLAFFVASPSAGRPSPGIRAAIEPNLPSSPPASAALSRPHAFTGGAAAQRGRRGPHLGKAVKPTGKAGGLCKPYPGLLPASVSRHTEIYFTGIPCPAARKQANPHVNGSLPSPFGWLFAARFPRCSKRTLFWGTSPPAKPVVSVNNQKRPGTIGSRALCSLRKRILI